MLLMRLEHKQIGVRASFAVELYCCDQSDASQRRPFFANEIAQGCKHAIRAQRRDLHRVIAHDLKIRRVPAHSLSHELAERLGTFVSDAGILGIGNRKAGVANLFLDREFVAQCRDVEFPKDVAERDELAHLRLDARDSMVKFPHQVDRKSDERCFRVDGHGVAAGHADAFATEWRQHGAKRTRFEHEIAARYQDHGLRNAPQERIDRCDLPGASAFDHEFYPRVPFRVRVDEIAGAIGAAARNHDQTCDAMGDVLSEDAIEQTLDVGFLIVRHDADGDRATSDAAQLPVQ